MDERIALITGAAKGIGLEAARQLGRAGWQVVVAARRPEQAEAAAARLGAEGISAWSLELDVADEAKVAAAAGEVEARSGRLDLLVNNAGVNFEFGTGTRPSMLELDTLQATYRANVFGPFLAIKHFLPLLRRGTTPQIINVSSSLGSLTIGTDPGHPLFGLNMLAYNSSKTALNALTVGFAKELATDGISVTSICPGWVRTDMGGDDAPRSVEKGARIILSVASDPQPGVSRFVDDAGAVAW